MRTVKIFFYSIFLICILAACSGISDVPKILRNEKINSTDEFLVKKREPLTEPPDAKKLPTPNSKSSEEDSDGKKDGIESILKDSKEKNDTNQMPPSSLENLIISQIKK